MAEAHEGAARHAAVLFDGGAEGGGGLFGHAAGDLFLDLPAGWPVGHAAGMDIAGGDPADEGEVHGGRDDQAGGQPAGERRIERRRGDRAGGTEEGRVGRELVRTGRLAWWGGC